MDATSPSTEQAVRRGRPSDVSDPVRVTVSLTPEQLDWLERQTADSRSQAVRRVIDGARGNANDLPALDLHSLNQDLAQADAPSIVQWAADTFADGLVMTSSFGAQAAVMLHLVTRVVPDIAVIWVDTGFNFPETYRFADALTRRLKLNLKVYQSPISPARMVAAEGQLWEQGEQGMQRYNTLRKVEPQLRALRDLGATALLTGVRGEQTQHRGTMRTVDLLNGVYNVRPILRWSASDVDEYLSRHDLPHNPLVDSGYKSIGDWHSTLPVSGDMSDREGRFRGLKQECGLHLPQTREEILSRDSSGL